jgi:hypothetical protein
MFSLRAGRQPKLFACSTADACQSRIEVYPTSSGNEDPAVELWL